MTKTHIVGLCGLADTGKDTVASILAECGGFVRLAFADTLRAEIVEAFDIDVETLTRREVKEAPTAALSLRRCSALGFVGAAVLAMEQTGKLQAGFLDEHRSPRWVMQMWGTEYRRKQNPAYWTRIIVDKIVMARKNGQRHFVITDVRYENEASTIKLMGGRMWQVKRPGVEAVRAHSSENDGSQFQPAHVLDNAGDLKHLRSLCLQAYWELDTGLAVSELTGARDA